VTAQPLSLDLLRKEVENQAVEFVPHAHPLPDDHSGYPTVLRMGDGMSPRRNFIERNAIKVATTDV
jgi:hypothetical protein